MDDFLRAAIYSLSPMELKTFLNRLLAEYHRPELLWSDPLEFSHRYPDPWDREAVALVSALLAYGNVKQIRRSVDNLLKRMERAARSPSEFVRLVDRDLSWGVKALDGFVHRFNVGKDLALLLALLGRSWRVHGSLGAHFLSHHSPNAADISSALNSLIREWKDWAGRSSSRSFDYLLTAPEDGSACKRWCMFLRWMGRKDELDLGLWNEGSPLAGTFPEGRSLRPSQLILPLDTHTGRISQYISLTRRKSLNWKAALEVTEALRACDPEDPSQYDFALSRLGILNLCQRKYREEICTRCQLVSVCRFARRKKISASRRSMR